MTIDETLAAVPQSEACWVVWSREPGEVLSVTAVDPATEPAGFAHGLQGLSEFQVPVKSRYLKCESVTRQLLERERDDALRIESRKQVLTAWAHAPVEALLRILERGEYPSAMNLDFDSRVIVQHLWELLRDELDAGIQARLRALVERPLLGEAASRELEICLLALAGDHDALGAIWRGERPGRTCFRDIFLLMDCLAHVRTRDPGVIGDLIDFVERGGMFTICRTATRTLGKLGVIAEPRAASVIRAAIHDSSPQTVAERERILRRMEGVDAEWVRCGACCHGQVHRAGSHGIADCPACLGLGFVAR